MTDRELLEMALDVIETYGLDYMHGLPKKYYVITLRARLATCDRCGKVNPAELHTCTPPQREWVGLTDEDKKAIYEQADIEGWHDQPLLEAVEAKLKEKNT